MENDPKVLAACKRAETMRKAAKQWKAQRDAFRTALSQTWSHLEGVLAVGKMPENVRKEIRRAADIAQKALD